MRRGKGLKEENVFLTHNYESAELGCKPKYAPLQASALYFSEQIRLRPALSRAGGNRRNQGTAFFSDPGSSGAIFPFRTVLLSVEQSRGTKSMRHPCYVNFFHTARGKLYLRKATSITQAINL